MFNQYISCILSKVCYRKNTNKIIVSPKFRIMLSNKEIEEMHIAFDFSRQYTVARVPKEYKDAENFALECVYSLRPYIANKLNIDCTAVIMVAISKNNKVVVLCDNNRYRNWLWNYFHKSSVGSAQFYDDIEPKLIIKKLDELFPE